MLYIHRLPIIFTIVCTCLSACAAPTEIPIPSPTITATQLPTVSPTETLVPTITPEPTATDAPLEIPEYITDIKTVNNPLKWRSAPEIDLKDTPALAHVLMDRFNNGEFDDLIPANFHYVPFNFSISGYKYHGITTALYPLVGNPTSLYGMENRWYFLSSMYKNKESGATIAHYFIKQKDGGVGQYLANIGVSLEKVADGSTNYLVGYIAGSDQLYSVPADFSNVNGCTEMTTGDAQYCDYYMNNRDLILELYKNWAKTGFVPVEISSGEVIIALQGGRATKP